MDKTERPRSPPSAPPNFLIQDPNLSNRAGRWRVDEITGKGWRRGAFESRWGEHEETLALGSAATSSPPHPL